jgi:chromate transporter
MSSFTSSSRISLHDLSIWFALHTVFRETSPVRSSGYMPVLSSADIAALILAVAAATAVFRFNIDMLTMQVRSCAAGVLLRLAGMIEG